MSNDDNGERDDGDEASSPAERRAGSFRLGLDLGPLTDLLGSLIELQVNQPPPGESVGSRSESAGRRSDGRRGRAREPLERRSRHRESSPDQCRVDARFDEDDDELTVVADLPGASRDDVSVGIEPQRNELVIGRGGRRVRRVEIPWASAEATRVWFNNGVLEVRLRPTDG